MKAKDFSKKFKKIMQEVVDDVANPKAMEKMGEASAELIRKRTRLGYGVNEQGGSKQRLKKLTDPYKKTRKRNKPTGPTTPAKSNLTYTGDMLDDLQPVKSSYGKTEIGFSDDYQKQKAGWVEEGGRPFNYLSKSEIKQLEQGLSDELADRIKKGLKKLK